MIYRLAKKKNLKAEINVVPYIDVMLVLLIIFMVLSPLLIQGIEVNLPQTDTTKMSVQNEPLVISIDKTGNYFINQGTADSHLTSFPNFPDYYISDLLAWHIGTGGTTVKHNGDIYDEGGIVGFDPFGVSAMGDISTSLRVGPRYQSQQPDYGFGFMDFMSLMGIFALLNNMRFMGSGGSIPSYRNSGFVREDPYLDPVGACLYLGKYKKQQYDRSALGRASAISGAIYDDIASVFGFFGDILVPDFLNPVSYTHLRAHETPEHLVCRLLR